MTKRQIVAQLTTLDTALEEYVQDLVTEKLMEPGEALSSFIRSVTEVDLNELKDDIAFNWTPDLADYLGERIRDAASAIESVGVRSFLSHDHIMSYDYVIDAVRRVQEIIRRILEKTSPKRRRTPKRGKAKELTKKQANVVEMVDGHNQSFVEIARLWGHSTQSVQQLYERARKNPGYKKPRSVNLSKAKPLHANTRQKS